MDWIYPAKVRYKQWAVETWQWTLNLFTAHSSASVLCIWL
jgi:hypothetical protein